MKQNSSTKIPLSLLLFQAVAISLFWLILAWHNRLVHDDLTLLKTVHEHGVLGAMIHFWEHWNTRWASLLWINSWYSIWNYQSPPFIYHLLTFIFIVGSFYTLLKSLERKSLIQDLTKTKRFCFSIICFGALLSATYNIGDTWFWVNTSAMYGWNLGCIIFALAILLRKQEYFHLLILIPFGLYIGGAGELPAVLISLGSSAIFLPKIYKRINPDYRFFILQIFVIIGFSLAYSGAGHSIRSEALPETNFQQVISGGVYAALKIILYKSPLRLFATILILLPLISLLPSKNENKLSLKNFLMLHCLPVFIFWVIIVCCHAFIITKLMGDAGPERAWSGISLVSVMCIGWILIKLNELDFRIPSIQLVMIITILLIFGICIQQWKVLNSYTSTLDERMQQLLQEQTTSPNDTITFKAMPNVKFLHNADPGFSLNGAWIGSKNSIVIISHTSLPAN